ncbi:unnamed protein product [Mytilus coruscus]|uniref:Uncharacterized protein n=1 Tax=Mytilus coruscus TaxID=42192 RepID=A0A6J8AHZ1_MYTCO|nr:unnamed protein product [Mytilus coruscus]
MPTTINDEIAGRNSDESAHYIEIGEDDVLNTLQENNNQIIATDVRIVSVSEEENLELPNSDSDTSEHAVASLENETNASEYLNDGYEHPYTILLAYNYAVDEHTYLTTKTNSINNNSRTFRNAAYEHSFTSREQDYSQDKQKTHIFASDGQENITLDYFENNLNEPDHDLHLINVNSQINAAEYINLSLKE